MHTHSALICSLFDGFVVGCTLMYACVSCAGQARVYASPHTCKHVRMYGRAGVACTGGHDDGDDGAESYDGAADAGHPASFGE